MRKGYRGTKRGTTGALAWGNESGLLPLHIALVHVQHECVKVLLERGVSAHVGLQGMYPVHLAFGLAEYTEYTEDCVTCVKHLVNHDKTTLNHIDRRRRAILHFSL